MTTHDIGNTFDASCDAAVRSLRFPTFVNENVVRWNALLTVVTLGVAYVATPWLLILLVADFSARVLTGPRYSPFARSGAWVMRRLGVKQKMIPGAPKRFAAGIGLGLASLTAALALTGIAGAWVVAAVIAVCAGLEAVFAFCVGCVVYAGLGKLGIVDECPTCFQ